MTKSSKCQILTIPQGKDDLLKKVKLEGVWSLTEEHDLKLRVIGSESPYFGKTLLMRGDIIKVTGSSLVFKLRDRKTIKNLKTQMIELKGIWQSDKNNRLVFLARKNKDEHNKLVFQGAWQINKRNELIYKYLHTALKTKTRVTKTLIFKGKWNLGEDRLVYSLEGSRDSYFTFKVSLQSRTLRAKDGEIRYNVGVRYSQKKVRHNYKQNIAIRGKWKFGKDLSVGFEVLHTAKRIKKIDFVIEKLVAYKNTVTVKLKSISGKITGIEVLFNKVFENDMEMFLSLSKNAANSSIIGGVKIRF